MNPRHFSTLRPGLRGSARAAAGVTIMLGLFTGMVTGCNSTERAGDPTSSSSRGTQIKPGTTIADPAVLAQIEQQHVIGPAAARDLNYRVAWQHVAHEKAVKHFSVQGDAAFVLDNRNFLTRIRVSDGERLWRTSIAAEVEAILGVTLLDDKIYVTTGGAVLVLDGGTGAQSGRQPLDKFANTAPVVFNKMLIYGSRNGQVVWHSAPVGYYWRAYQVAHSIELSPVLHDDILVAVAHKNMEVLSPVTATRFWNITFLSDVVAQPAIGNGALFVAGMDQYLRAYDAATGRKLWWVLTPSPLKESPVLVGERVYQQVPGQGLTCYTAVPLDTPGGELIWKSPDVNGSVVMERRENLFAWDQPSTRLTVLDTKGGGVVQTLDLPQVKKLVIAGEKNNEIFAVANDGRVVRLVPRN